MTKYIDADAIRYEQMLRPKGNGMYEECLIAYKDRIDEIPSADVIEPIRCKDCRWWDKYNNVMGYCMAAKHGHWSKHWEITIHRTYDGDFYCADAERRET